MPASYSKMLLTEKTPTKSIFGTYGTIINTESGFVAKAGGSSTKGHQCTQKS